jgi:hypothetical protein
MNPLIELDRQSASLQSWQLLLMLVFLLGYVSTIGGLFAQRGRWRAAFIAALAGIGLCALTAPWVLGALLLAVAVGAVGLFAAAALLTSRLLGLDRRTGGEASEPVADAVPQAVRPGRPRPAKPATVG